MNPEPAGAFDANGASRGAVREIGLPLLWLALLLLPFDVGVRRLLIGHDQVATALRRAGLGRLVTDQRPRDKETRRQGDEEIQSDSESPPLPLSPSPGLHASAGSDRPAKPPKRAKPAADLERLREAQERARRRARGEE
jgi:hypothetical protein